VRTGPGYPQRAERIRHVDVGLGRRRRARIVAGTGAGSVSVGSSVSMDITSSAFDRASLIHGLDLGLDVGGVDVGDVGATLATGALMYLAVVSLLRVSGKRTLSKLNAFDFVVSVALGSVLATTLVSGSTSLAVGFTAALVLVGGQFAVAWLSVRLRLVRLLVRSTPAVLVKDGRPQSDILDRQRVTQGDLRQAVRAAGFGGFDAVGAIVLETDGTMSVIGADDIGDGSALADCESSR
jgi:hypothetical protein